MKAFATFLLFTLTCIVACEQPRVVDPDVLESRGIWLGKEEMLLGREDLSARLDRYRQAGFNTVYLATQVRGFVTYPGSSILPQWQDMAELEGDIFGWLVSAIHGRGMRAEAWTEYGFYAYWTPDAEADPSRGPVLDGRPDLTSIDRYGNTFLHNPEWGDYYSLCPANPASHEILSALYLEIMTRYPFDGLNLDRIRFADGSFCYCDYCTTHFAEDTGLTLNDVGWEGEDENAFVAWRAGQVNDFIHGFSETFRRRLPGRKLTAAVIPPYMVEEKGQDWVTWLNSGWVDAVMPMLYDPDITEYVDWIETQAQDPSRIYYGLHIGLGFDIFRRQVEFVRERGARGITVWSSHAVDPHLGRLREELFIHRTASPLYTITE